VIRSHRERSVKRRPARQDPVRQAAARGKGPESRQGQRAPAQTVGALFRAARHSQELSQEQLAAVTRGRPGRVSRAMISAIERGVHLPGLEVLLTLAQALHVPPAEVLERLELSRSGTVDTEGLSFEEIDRHAGRSFWSGDHRRSAAYYEAGLRWIAEHPDADAERQRRLVATTEIRCGTALRRCGAATAARAAVERAISMTDDMPDLQAQGYVVLTALLVQLGCLPLARDAGERAVEIAESCEPRVRGWAWIEKGEVLAASGCFSEARLAFLEARRFVREAGDRNHQINVEGNLGACLRGLGRNRQARGRFLGAVELARQFEVPAAEALWLVELGWLALDEQDLDQAEAYAQAALRIAGLMKHQLTQFRAEWLRHCIQRRRCPDDPDRHRVAHLRKLFTRLEQHRGIAEIREFKLKYCGSSSFVGGPS